MYNLIFFISNREMAADTLKPEVHAFMMRSHKSGHESGQEESRPIKKDGSVHRAKVFI